MHLSRQPCFGYGPSGSKFAVLLLALSTVLLPAAGFGAPGPNRQVLDSGTFFAPDGEVFTYQKALEGSAETVTYYRGSETWSAAKMKAHLAALEEAVLDPALVAAASSAPAGSDLELVAWLRSESGGDRPKDILRRSRGDVAAEVQALAEEIRSVRLGLRPVVSLREGEERSWVKTGGPELPVVLREYVRTLSQQIEDLQDAARRQAQLEISAAISADQALAATLIEGLGGTVQGTLASQNAVALRLPADRLAELAQDELIAKVILVPAGSPELDNQASSLGLTTGFWSDGITGGIWDGGVLDTGVQQNHPALNPTSWISNFGNTDASGHGTSVAGILFSDNATYRGMAYGLDAALVGNANSVMSHADWMVSTAAQDPEAVNLSFGYGVANVEDYSVFDSFFDGLIDDNHVSFGKSTGNSGNGATTITRPAPAYNLLAVANIFDQNTATRTDDLITSSSSRGPTLAGRKKPDIAAPGTSTISTNNDWATQADFVSFGGTSAAAPHVTGATLLVTELRGTDSPAANKAVLLNTADAWTDGGTLASTADDGLVAGSEWNATYGWGYLDLWEAWFNGPDVFEGAVDDGVTPPGQDFRLFRGFMFADEKATLVWNRHVAFNGSANPTAVEDLSDLDLLAYRESDNTLLASTNSGIDNVEQIASPSSATVVLKVDVFGILDPDVGVETFALATEENFEAVDPPALSFGLVGTQASPGQPFPFSLSVFNGGDVPAHQTAVNLTLPPGFSVVSGANPQALPTIAGGSLETASWEIQAACVTGLVNLSFNAQSVSYGESFQASNNVNLNVNTLSLTADSPLFNNATPRTYDFPVLGIDWSVVAVHPGAGSLDLAADDDLCIPSPYQQSTAAGSAPDFTVTNGHVYGAATHYALVEGAAGSYFIELDEAVDQPTNSLFNGDFALGEVVDLFEVNMFAGDTYEIRAVPTSGTPDPALFGYSFARADGSRNNADVAATSRGPGEAERLIFNADVGGNHAFALVNENGDPGTYTLFVTQALFADGFESGNTGAWTAAVGEGALP